GTFNSLHSTSIFYNSEFEPTLWCGAFNSVHMTTSTSSSPRYGAAHSTRFS
ncbi:6608_t:CDS:1, partial [Ambispora leptoticha]